MHNDAGVWLKTNPARPGKGFIRSVLANCVASSLVLRARFCASSVARGVIACCCILRHCIGSSVPVFGSSPCALPTAPTFASHLRCIRLRALHCASVVRGARHCTASSTALVKKGRRVQRKRDHTGCQQSYPYNLSETTQVISRRAPRWRKPPLRAQAQRSRP